MLPEKISAWQRRNLFYDILARYEGEQKNPAVDTGLIQNLTDSKDMDGIAQYLDAIYKEVEGSLDYHGLKQISRELFMLLKKLCPSAETDGTGFQHCL
ncbi:hypothetical protein [Blautia sp.]|uniref:hypothetical protein n=1 Tax=Blautia sp. TaxID=1955243 RepID=UPI0039925222